MQEAEVGGRVKNQGQASFSWQKGAFCVEGSWQPLTRQEETQARLRPLGEAYSGPAWWKSAPAANHPKTSTVLLLRRKKRGWGVGLGRSKERHRYSQYQFFWLWREIYKKL